MPGRLAGQLVDGGDPVADEPVFVVDTGPADESNWSIVATDRSAADGSWSVTVPNTDPKRYHAVAQFEESGTLKNALSKPFLTSQSFAQPGLVTVGFDVLSPAVGVGSVIPGAIHRWPTDEGTGSTLTDSIGDNDGTISGATWVTNSSLVGGQGLNFDGSDDYVSFTTVPHLENINNSFSMTWTVDIAAQSGVYLWGHQVGSVHYAVSWDLDGNLMCRGIDGDQSVDERRATSIEPSGLSRIGFGWDGDNHTPKLYLNGSQADDQAGGGLGLDATGTGHRLCSRPNRASDHADVDNGDNPFIYDSLLPDSGFQDDYQRQPWS